MTKKETAKENCISRKLAEYMPISITHPTKNEDTIKNSSKSEFSRNGNSSVPNKTAQKSPTSIINDEFTSTECCIEYSDSKKPTETVQEKLPEIKTVQTGIPAKARSSTRNAGKGLQLKEKCHNCGLCFPSKQLLFPHYFIAHKFAVPESVKRQIESVIAFQQPYFTCLHCKVVYLYQISAVVHACERHWDILDEDCETKKLKMNSSSQISEIYLWTNIFFTSILSKKYENIMRKRQYV